MTSMKVSPRKKLRHPERRRAENVSGRRILPSRSRRTWVAWTWSCILLQAVVATKRRTGFAWSEPNPSLSFQTKSTRSFDCARVHPLRKQDLSPRSAQDDGLEKRDFRLVPRAARTRE